MEGKKRPPEQTKAERGGIDALFGKVKQASISTLEPYLEMARTGEKSEGQFRVRWLRRIIIALWFLSIAISFFFVLFDVILLFFSEKLVSFSSGFMFYLSNIPKNCSFVSLVFDLWMLAALRYLGRIWRSREQGDKEKTKIWYIVAALAMAAARGSNIPAIILISFVPIQLWFIWPITHGLLPPLALIVSGAINLLTLYLAITVFILAVVVFPVKVFEAVLNIGNALLLTKAKGVHFLGTFIAFWYWFTGKEVPINDAPDETKGARFATPQEIEALRAAEGMAFGHVNGAPLFLQNEKHVLLTASTRSGKGVALLIPHLLRYRGSAFVLDPKGENARATGRHRERLNSKVHYLDPFGISGKPQSRFNPLSRFTPENMEAESKALAAALVMGEQGARDHWTGSAQQLLAAVILHVVTTPTLSPQEKDLGTVRRLLLENINGVFRLMLDSEAADGLLARLAVSFLQTPEKEFGSILSTAQRETEILDNPAIVASLAASGPRPEVDFADWHRGAMSVFLCLSAPKFPVFNRWLRLILTSALDEMTDSLNPPDLPVCFMLDELATLGHLQAVENAVGLAAGYGIQLVSVFQDVAQMRDLYKGRWASFIGNAGVRAIFALDDYDTAHYWSQFMGGRLVETTSYQQDDYGQSKGHSKGEAMRPFLSPEKLMLSFSKDQMLVLAQGSHPIITDRVAYFDDTGLKTLWDDPRKPLPRSQAKVRLIDVVSKQSAKAREDRNTRQKTNDEKQSEAKAPYEPPLSENKPKDTTPRDAPKRENPADDVDIFLARCAKKYVQVKFINLLRSLSEKKRHTPGGRWIGNLTSLKRR